MDQKIFDLLNKLNVKFAEDSLARKFAEQDVDFDSFMLMNDEDLKSLDFGLGARRKIMAEVAKNSTSNERDTFIARNRQPITDLSNTPIPLDPNIISCENEKEPPMSRDDLVKIEILKTLAFDKRIGDTSATNANIDAHFSSIILGAVSSELIERGLNENALISTLKPYLFDALKRTDRLSAIKAKILEFVCVCDKSKCNANRQRWSHMSKLDERDLLGALIQSVNVSSRAKLGSLIAKNDYPLPLGYSTYNVETQRVEQQIAFDLFADVLCLTHKSLAVVSGSRHAAFKGKSTLIPLMFNADDSSLLGAKSTHKSTSRLTAPTLCNNVDVVCNEETSGSWIVADFHSTVESAEARNLLKAFAAYASLHLVHVTIDDFDDDGAFSRELAELIHWHKSMHEAPSTSSPYIVLVLRDYSDSARDAQKVEQIRQTILGWYESELISLLTLEDVSRADDESVPFRKKELADELNEIVLHRVKRKAMHSIDDIRTFFDKLNDDAEYKLNAWYMRPVELKFNELFHGACCFESDDAIETTLFPLAHMDRQIKEALDELKKLTYVSKQGQVAENRLRQLKDERSHRIDPLSAYICMFVDLMRQDTFVTDLLVFENCLLELKRDRLAQLRSERQAIQDELELVVQRLKRKENASLVDGGRDGESGQLMALQDEKRRLESDIKRLDDRIDIMDLTVDKFWDEVFAIYDWVVEKEACSPLDIDSPLAQFRRLVEQTLLERYLSLVEYGFPIHILRGRPLRIQSRALELVFERLRSDHELLIVTVIGEQSSAKSSLLNSLFGCTFRTSAGRCTVGIYLHFVNYQDKKIVILDSEGLMSIESSSSSSSESSSNTFDNQLATMAVLSSHLILVNHKGEISTNLERLLGITFYAKLRTSKSGFKPTLMFVLRDQTDRNESSVATQASKLKAKLVQQAAFVDASIDDVMHIDTHNIKLLCNAFSEEMLHIHAKEVKWRNSLFPRSVLALRADLFDTLERMNRQGHVFPDLASLYTSMCSYWTTLDDLGDGILNCKDLEEIKLRNEMSAKCSKLVAKFESAFYDTCKEITHRAMRQLDDNGYSEEVDLKTTSAIRSKYDEVRDDSVKEFHKQTNLSCFPAELRREYEARIVNNLDRVHCIALETWTQHSSYVKETSKLESIKKELVRFASDLILNGTVYNWNFHERVDTQFDAFDKQYEQYLVTLIESEDSFDRKLIDCYNHNCKLFKFNIEYKNFESTPNLIESIKTYAHKLNKREQSKSWFDSASFVDKVTTLFRPNRSRENCFKWIVSTLDNKIIPDVKKQITKPFVEDSHVRSVFQIINAHLFADSNSPVVQYKSLFNINKLTFDLLVYTLDAMLTTYCHLKQEEIEAKRRQYAQFRDEMRANLNNDYKCMRDAKAAGENVAGQMFTYVRRFLMEESKLRAQTETTDLLNKTLKNAEELIEHAFKRSFEALDYKSVYKYVNDVVEYCTEVSEQMTEQQVNAIIRSEKSVCAKNMEIVGSLLSARDNYSDTAKTIYEFIDSFVKSAEDKCQLEDDIVRTLKKTKQLIVDGNIDKTEHFVKSFEEKIINNTTHFQRDPSYFNAYDRQLEYAVKEHTSKCLKKIIGCSSKCPGCGMKCTQMQGHQGDHHANKHVLNGFNGWHYEGSKIICTDYCWEKKFYLNPVSSGDEKKTYTSFTKYVEAVSPLWLSDIKQNFAKYETGNQSAAAKTNQAFIDFDYKMRKSWMNVRKAILAQNDLKDREYDNEWLELEDTDNMLTKDSCTRTQSSFTYWSNYNYRFNFYNETDNEEEGEDYGDGNGTDNEWDGE